MTRKVSKASGRESLKLFRHLAVALVLFLVAQAGWGQTTYYWVGGNGNWTDEAHWNTQANGNGTNAPSGGPVAADTVYIIDGSTITLAANTTIQNLRIANYNATATLNLAGNSLVISDTLNLGTGNDATTNNYNAMQGRLVICSNTNASVSMATFDICDDGDNYLELQKISCEISTNYWVNGDGHTIITGDSSSSFAHHAGRRRAQSPVR